MLMTPYRNSLSVGGGMRRTECLSTYMLLLIFLRPSVCADGDHWTGASSLLARVLTISLKVNSA